MCPGAAHASARPRQAARAAAATSAVRRSMNRQEGRRARVRPLLATASLRQCRQPEVLRAAPRNRCAQQHECSAARSNARLCTPSALCPAPCSRFAARPIPEMETPASRSAQRRAPALFGTGRLQLPGMDAATALPAERATLPAPLEPSPRHCLLLLLSPFAQVCRLGSDEEEEDEEEDEESLSLSLSLLLLLEEEEEEASALAPPFFTDSPGFPSLRCGQGPRGRKKGGAAPQRVTKVSRG